jgi:serine/threonine-protein kinase
MAINPVPFGKYELISRLAAGGMAEIFLAPHQVDPRLRKVSRHQEDLAQSHQRSRVRAHVPRRGAGRRDARHPNIVQIYDVGHVESEYFIAMEYLPWPQPDRDSCAPGAKLGYSKPPLEHVMSVLSGLCAGLHTRTRSATSRAAPLEIVHRDVTPQNVVGHLRRRGQGRRLRHRQGGHARGGDAGRHPQGQDRLYVARAVPRPGRRPPQRSCSPVGIILYELTTGKRLYHERSDFETLKKIIEGPVPSPRDILPFYPAALNGIVVRCLQKNADDRYQTARDLHADSTRSRATTSS